MLDPHLFKLSLFDACLRRDTVSQTLADPCHSRLVFFVNASASFWLVINTVLHDQCPLISFDGSEFLDAQKFTLR